VTWYPRARRVIRQANIGGMNKTEIAYQAVLDLRWRVGEILYYEYEAVTLKIGHDLRYTPDFLVLNKAGEIEFHETKWAVMQEDSIVKIRAAATKWPFFRFIIAKRQDSGQNFELKEMLPMAGA
jgi:hypothetical protein